MKNTNKSVRKAGRPSAIITFPNKKFTFADLQADNTHVTALTLRKHLSKDMFTEDGNARRNSEIVRVKDETREPNHETGLGRKTFVYIKRSRIQAKKPTVTVNIGTSGDVAATAPIEQVAVTAQ